MPEVSKVEPSPALPASCDVVVVGGGIIGAATAYYLARRGLKVALCEKGEIGAEQSARNWGFCRSQGRDPAEVPLMLESLGLWRGLAAEIGEDLGFREAGILYLVDSEERLASYERWLERAAPLGLSTRLLSGREAAALIPGCVATWKGALYTPDDGRAEPELAAAALARAARRRGASLHTGCAVRGFLRKAGRIAGVATERGEIAAQAVVVAGGAWSALLLRQEGVYFPQLKVRASVLRTAPTAEVFSGGLWAPGFSLRRRLDGGYSIAHGGQSAFDLVPDLLRYFRAFLPAWRSEGGGMKLRLGRRFVTELAYERPLRAGRPSPFERERVLDPAPVESILEQALANLKAAFPALADIEVVERWASHIDATPDAVPAISAIESLPGLYLASGFSGHGFGIGPGAGKLMAALVAGDPPSVDPAPFRHGRFLDGRRPRPYEAP